MLRWLRQHLDGRSVRILLGLTALALVLDALFFTGFYGSDDVSYILGARSIATDGSLSAEFGATRIGLVLPGAVVWWLTGGSLAALLWFHVAYHLALVPIAYVLARLLHGERAGLVAAALVATSPLLYGFAGAVLPDNAATCCVGLAMIALVATKRYADPGVRLTSWSPRRFAGYFVAGAMVGFCYWCKESAVVLTIPAAVYLMTAGPSLRSLVWIQNGASFTLGIVAVFALELVVLRVLTGEWINRLTYVGDAAEDLRAAMATEGATPLARLGYGLGQVTRWMPISTWLLLAGAAGYSFTRARNAGIALFCWFPALYMTIGSTSFSSWVPPPIQGRYYAMVLLPAAVMAAITASVLVERWGAVRPRLARWGVVATLALVAVVECRAALPMSGTLYRARDVWAFEDALERAAALHPGTPIVISPYYGHRMGPLLFDRDDVISDGMGTPRPPAPYVYVRKAVWTEYPDPEPLLPATERIEGTVIVTPPRNRWTSLLRWLDDRELPAGDNYWWAQVLLVVPRR